MRRIWRRFSDRRAAGWVVVHRGAAVVVASVMTLLETDGQHAQASWIDEVMPAIQLLMRRAGHPEAVNLPRLTTRRAGSVADS
jgi:hypothetical protein